MKYTFIITMVCVLGVAGYYFYTGNSITVENVKEVIVEKEVTMEVSELEKRIVDAQNASSSEIEAKSKKAYDTEKMRLMTEIELSVTRAYREEIEARESELEESVSLVSARVN